MDQTDIVTLDVEQKARAEKLLRKYQDDGLNAPKDVVDEWRRPQTRKTNHDFDTTQREEYIDPTEIVGRLGSGATHFEPGKAAKHLSWLYKGEFDRLKSYPPMLEKRPEGYFVTDDGTHRSIAAKGIGLDRLYVEYYSVPSTVLEER